MLRTSLVFTTFVITKHSLDYLHIEQYLDYAYTITLVDESIIKLRKVVKISVVHEVFIVYNSYKNVHFQKYEQYSCIKIFNNFG